jgi:hypothetical protein
LRAEPAHEAETADAHGCVGCVGLCQEGDYMSFKPLAIQSISFGCKTHPDHEMQMQKLLSQKQFTHVRINKYIRSKLEYKLERQIIR